VFVAAAEFGLAAAAAAAATAGGLCFFVFLEEESVPFILFHGRGFLEEGNCLLGVSGIGGSGGGFRQ